MYGTKYRYKRRFKRFRRAKKTYKRFKGYKRKDYTPVVKLEAHYAVRTSNVIGSFINLDINSSGGAGQQSRVPYTDVFDNNGTWGKYKDFYTQYMITGVSAEFSFTKDSTALDNIWVQQPVINCVNFPAYDTTVTPTAQEVRQMDNVYTIIPRSSSIHRYYQRYPRNYINTNLTKVGIGTWNTITNSSAQNGIFCMTVSNNATPTNTSIPFGYLKLCLYVRFGGKRI